MKRPSFGSSSNNNNNNNSGGIPPVTGNVLYNSYQKGNGGNSSITNTSNYQPPIFYVKDQTAIVEDTTKVYYETDETANKVLHQLTSQRQQIQNTDTDIHTLQYTTQLAQKEMEVLRNKYRRRKQQYYILIAILSILDIVLYLRLLQCHGNFFCW